MSMQADFPGMPLRESEFREGGVITVRWDMKARYAWDAGIAIGHYLTSLKNGIIFGVHCRACRRTVVPPRVVCEQCFHPMADWVELKDTGRVNTFSLSHLTWDAQRIEKPIIPAVIEIHGASPGVGILHVLGEVEPAAVKIGMRVQAVWLPPSKRRGAITDIRYFKPV